MTTPADGTTAPPGSATVPVIVPRSLCANVESDHAANQSDTDSNRTRPLLIVTSLGVPELGFLNRIWKGVCPLGKGKIKKIHVLELWIRTCKAALSSDRTTGEPAWNVARTVLQHGRGGLT